MKYIMLLRGMGPGDPKFNNQTVCECLKGLGYSNVRALQASGNYLFESVETDHTKLEAAIEESIETNIGYKRAVIVRSAQAIAKIMERDRFGGLTHGKNSYLLVTFMKRPKEPDFTLPYSPTGKAYTVVSVADGVVYSATDTTVAKTPDTMVWLEKQFGKDITSRTWNTVQRIYQKLA